MVTHLPKEGQPAPKGWSFWPPMYGYTPSLGGSPIMTRMVTYHGHQPSEDLLAQSQAWSPSTRNK